MTISVNYLAVLVAAALYYLFGAAWYSIFSKPWMKAMNKSDEDLEEMRKSAPKGYAVSAVASLITAYILAHLIVLLDSATFLDGVETGMWISVGFVLTTSLSQSLFEDRPLTLYYISGGFNTLSIMLMGGILAIW